MWKHRCNGSRVGVALHRVKNLSSLTCGSAVSGFHSQSDHMVQNGCSSSSYHVCIPGSKKEERKGQRYTPSLVTFPESCTYHFHLHFVGQNLVSWPSSWKGGWETRSLFGGECELSYKSDISVALLVCEQDAVGATNTPKGKSGKAS